MQNQTLEKQPVNREMLVVHRAPEQFSAHYFERSFSVQAPIESVWEWLNTPSTFVDGQLFPFRVEFVAHDDGEADFRPGVLCNHHGPLMSFAGVIGKLVPHSYRDLQYFYGSYAISFRIIRPTRLQFWLQQAADEVIVTVGVDSLVRKGWHTIWNLGQYLFWPFFARGLRREFR